MQAISWIDVLAVMSGMALAITNILFRSVQDVPVMSKIAFMFMGSSVLILLSLIFFTAPAVQVSSATIVLAMLYGAVWLMLITLGTQWSVTQMEAGRSAIILVMELVAAVVSAALLTNNDLHWHEMAGSLLVVTAAMVEGLRVDNACKPV
jgi:drug/metabolite transporter (DMT)-like permease